MTSIATRLGRLKGGLFWRTFVLLAILTALSTASWVGMISAAQRGPQAQQTAELVVSVVTITKAALRHMRPELAKELLFDLVSREGIRVFLLESTDTVDPAPDYPLMPDIERIVKDRLGADTRFSGRVNGQAGFWVSFTIDDDQYWLMLERERIEGLSGAQWLGWASLAGMFSLLGAVLISSLVNLPLARLTAAAREIAQGRRPQALPEKGSTEIIEANRSFNQMVDDLQRVESDRALVLAGISHDLRTPLARMQLEIEMANLAQEAREGMQSDIAQMDAIIGQFLDFAKPSDAANFLPLDLSALVGEAAHEAARVPSLRVTSDIAPALHVLGNATELRRVLANLVENARRYGKTPGQEVSEIDLRCQLRHGAGGARVVIELQDHGAGVPDAQIAGLLKPFTRLDSARGQANGAGLGLAIVERVVARHQGELLVKNRVGGGLQILIALPPA
ncbi:MAG: ATP-binding protein [Pseudomonadota bacterium]